MAVALERFSIREYAAKARAADLGKCWPFDGGGKEGGEAGCSLPPISLRKFRWWLDELDAARSHHAGGDVRGGSGLATELEEAGPRDESMAEPMEDEEVTRQLARKGSKQRAPKKRSMAELFATAPQIEAAEEEEGGEEGQELNDGEGEPKVEGAGGGGAPDGALPEAPNKRKDRIHKDKKKETTRRKIRMNHKSSTSKEKQNELKVEICAAKKEKFRKPEMSCVVDISLLLQASVCKKRFGKTLMDPVGARKKKSHKLKSLSKKHSLKFIQTSKLITKNQREAAKVFPVYSILKNRTSAVRTKKTSLKGDALLKPCCESEKHVTFSGKDEILGHDKSSSPLELPQLQSLCKMFSDVLAASSAAKESNSGDKLPTVSGRARVAKENAEDVGTSVEESTVSSSSKKKQSHCHASFPTNLSNMNFPDTENTSSNETIDLNCVMQGYSNLNSLDPCDLSLSPRHSNSGSSPILNSTFKEGLSSDCRYQAEESFTRTSNATSLALPIGSCVTQSDGTSTLTITRSLVSQPPASCSITSTQANESRPHLSIEPELDSFRHSPGFQPVYNIPPSELMNSICYLMDPSKHGESGPVLDSLSDSLSNFRDKGINDGFLGLPINLQGELIKSNSSSKFGFVDPFKNQSLALGPDYTFPIPKFPDSKNKMDHATVKEMFSRAQNGCPDPATNSIASGIRHTELQDFGRIEVEKHGPVRDADQFVHQDRHPMRPSCYGCRESTQPYNWINRGKFQVDGSLDQGIQPATQTTMRLMGKNVTVGKSSGECHGFDDGKIWTDKEIIAEQCPSTRDFDGAHSVRWVQQERFAHPASGTSRENHLQLLEAPSSLYHAPAINTRYDCMRIDRQPQWRSSNDISSPIGNHGFEVNKSSRQLPPKAFPSRTSKSSIAIYNSVTESIKMGHRMPEVVSHPRNVCQQMLLSSTHCKHIQSLPYCSHPSFPNHDNGNLVERSSAHPSSNLPHWLLNAEQQKNKKTCWPSNNDPIAVSGSNLSHPPSYPASTVSPLHDTPAYSVQTPLMPFYQASKPSPAVNANYRDKIENRDGRRSNFAYLKLLDRGNITKKRPADRVDEFTRHVKRPNLRMHRQSNVPKRRDQLLGCAPYGTGYPKTPAYGNKAMDVGLRRMNSQMDGLRTAPGSNSLKFGGGSRPGPLKLSAGARHILKPSQTMDQDSPRPIHSVIPFAIGTSSGKIPVPRNKAANVYRFGREHLTIPPS